MSLEGDVGCTRQGTIITGAEATSDRNVTEARRMRLCDSVGSFSASAKAAARSPRLPRTASASAFFFASSRMMSQAQGCVLPPLGARIAASIIFQIASSGTGSGLNLRIERWVWTTSKKSTG